MVRKARKFFYRYIVNHSLLIVFKVQEKMHKLPYICAQLYMYSTYEVVIELSRVHVLLHLLSLGIRVQVKIMPIVLAYSCTRTPFFNAQYSIDMYSSKYLSVHERANILA